MSALSGTVVVDLSRVLAGPLCAQILADHGAEVVKVEPPSGDETRSFGPPFVDGTAAYFHALNRNKAAIVLDLKQEAAREVVLRLVERADVLIENFLPGTMEKWGLGYDTLAMRFPRLVYCSITGFGADGPLGGLPGYDAVLQAMSGLMSVNGDAQTGPTRIGVPVVDLSTGLNAAIGILLALSERARSGHGQKVEACLYDTALSLLVPQAVNWMQSGQEPRGLGSAHPAIYPYDKFHAGKGEVYLGVSNDAQFRRLCEAIGRPGLADDARFSSNGPRSANRAALRAELEAALAPREPQQLCDDLMTRGVPASPVNSVPAAFDHPHTAHRGMRIDCDGYKAAGIPLKLSRTPGEVRTSPPSKGADTRMVLSKLGYEERKIAELLESRAAA